MMKCYDVPLGVFETGRGKSKAIQVNYASDSKDCGIILYDRFSGVEIGRFAFTDAPVMGNIRQLTIPQYSLDKVSYLFYEEGKPVIEKNALMFAGKDTFGAPKYVNNYRSIKPAQKYDWEQDAPLQLPREKCIAYCLHVRGFTMHESSNVKAKGTFAGIIEKVSYLKELGVTTLELQPAYEFAEYPISFSADGKSLNSDKVKINYWGYTEGYYYAPKRAYTYGEDATVEFKDLVKALHQNGIELVMQFYFPDSFPVTEIAPILRYWHKEYHVDGFHLKGNNLPIEALAKDGYLYNAKLWYEGFQAEKLVNVSKKRLHRVASYHDEYLYCLRSFLKSDIGTLIPAVRCMFENRTQIKYLSNYYGFTMADMVSYQEKHNEANGEENRDGNDYNCTWNCGAEGECYKIEVQVLRERQLRNALALLLLSQGVLLIFMGDEFGNSQKGNNNPYCQDNEIAWLDWSDLKRHEGLHAYVKGLIQLRKAHAVFCMSEEILKETGNGLPGISYHGTEAWKLSLDENTLHMGVLLNDGSAKKGDITYWYIAINMHWESQCLALPKVNRDTQWEIVFSTEGALEDAEYNHQVVLGPRSISLFCIKEEEPFR